MFPRPHMSTLIAVILIGILAVVAVALYVRNRQSHRTCGNCGSPSEFGYSREAESELKDVVNLCFACLVRKLTDDYESYEGRALVVQPTAGFPCYVFQKGSRWPDSNLAKEVAEMLSATDDACNQCGSTAHYLWVTSNGLSLSNFEQLLSEGLSRTLLRWGNSRPVPLCARCCVKSITKTIQEHSLTFFEVCSPRSVDGFVIPMVY